MTVPPTPEEEDRRRLGRERKTLIAERVEHVNRIKGLLFSQGISDYEPLGRDRRKRLAELTTGDGRPLPDNLKASIGRELDRLELLLDQIRAVEAERDALLAKAEPPVGKMLRIVRAVLNAQQQGARPCLVSPYRIGQTHAAGNGLRPPDHLASPLHRARHLIYTEPNPAL